MLHKNGRPGAQTEEPLWLPRIDDSSPVPLYEQLIEQVSLAVVAGALRPGDPLPSVRRLAAQLRINPNTAARVGRELDRLGLSQTRRGIGSVVAQDAPRLAPVVARGALERELSGTVRTARRLGMDLTELLAAVEQRWRRSGETSEVES